MNYLSLTLLSLLVCSSARISIDPNTQTFRDELNRVRIFHGFAAVVKLPPYIPTQDHFDPQMSISDEDIDNMVNWGTKMVRLGVMWEAVEVAPSVFNYTFLDEVEKLINRLGAAGIYTIVDAHQDLFSRINCGEGFPYFYDVDQEDTCPETPIGRIFSLFGECIPMASYDLVTDEYGRPLISECQKHEFMKYYTSPEVASSFANFYSNKNGIQDKFLGFWNVVSQRFASNQYVAGYDILNEPWPANFYEEQKLLLEPGLFDKEKLQPLYAKIHTTIRANDDNKIIFFEPCQFPDTFPTLKGLVFTPGFTSTPGGVAYHNRESLNDHAYCCEGIIGVCNSGEPPLRKSSQCRDFLFHKASKRKEDAKNLGVPIFFTEFGACSNSTGCIAEITNSADAFDNSMVSWSYWMFKGFYDFTTFNINGNATEGIYDGDGKLQEPKIQALSRSYAHAFQGVPITNYFYTNSSALLVEYTLDTSIQAPTEIFFNEAFFYQNGYLISVSVDGQTVTDCDVTRVADANYLGVLCSNQDYNGKVVSVVLTPQVAKQGLVLADGIKVLYSMEQQTDRAQVNYEITGIKENLGAAYFLTLSTNNQELFDFSLASSFKTPSSKGFQSVFSLFKKTSSGVQMISKFSLHNLNGHLVKLGFERDQSQNQFVIEADKLQGKECLSIE